MSDRQLVDQPTKLPTRKLFAVILATFLVQGFVGTMEHFYPGITEVLPAQEWIELLVPLFVGYMARDRAVFVSERSEEDQDKDQSSRASQRRTWSNPE